jgi:hypothetical protein
MYSYWPVASVVTVAAMRQLQIWMHALGSRKISKTNMLIGQLKKCDATPHLRVAAVGPLLLERNDGQKCMYMAGVVCGYKQRIV